MKRKRMQESQTKTSIPERKKLETLKISEEDKSKVSAPYGGLSFLLII